MVFIPPCVLCLVLYLYYLLFSRNTRAFTFQKAFSAAPSGRFQYALSAKSGIVLGNSTDICRGSYQYLFYQCLLQAAFRKEFVPYVSSFFISIPICCSILYSNYTIKLVNNSTATLEYMRKVRTVFCPDFLAQS